MITRRWRNRAIEFGVWTLLVVIFAAEAYIGQAVMGKPISYVLALRRCAEEWYLWGLLSLWVRWLCRRVPIEPGNIRRGVIVHFIGSLVTALAFIAGVSALLDGQTSVQTGHPLTFKGVSYHLVADSLLYEIFIYWVFVAGVHSLEFYRRYRERELAAAALAGELVEARLETLRMQLNPHFLFNTLNTISSLIHTHPEAADQMVARLSDLLRFTLDRNTAQQVPLRQELALLDRYLDIERIRFQDRLTVNKRIDRDVEDLLVPCLMLQPLVENAIRHGIEPREDVGQIDIEARQRDGHLELIVRDNGTGLTEDLAGTRREGIGLSNTRSRLRHLYGENQNFELTAANGGGLEVRLMIPLCTQPSNGAQALAKGRVGVPVVAVRPCCAPALDKPAAAP